MYKALILWTILSSMQQCISSRCPGNEGETHRATHTASICLYLVFTVALHVIFIILMLLCSPLTQCLKALQRRWNTWRWTWTVLYCLYIPCGNHVLKPLFGIPHNLFGRHPLLITYVLYMDNCTLNSLCYHAVIYKVWYIPCSFCTVHRVPT